MGLYQWRGSRAVLIDVGPLEPALSYSSNTVVHVTHRAWSGTGCRQPGLQLYC